MNGIPFFGVMMVYSQLSMIDDRFSATSLTDFFCDHLNFEKLTYLVNFFLILQNMYFAERLFIKKLHCDMNTGNILETILKLQQMCFKALFVIHFLNKP